MLPPQRRLLAQLRRVGHLVHLQLQPRPLRRGRRRSLPKQSIHLLPLLLRPLCPKWSCHHHRRRQWRRCVVPRRLPPKRWVGGSMRSRGWGASLIVMRCWRWSWGWGSGLGWGRGRGRMMKMSGRWMMDWVQGWGGRGRGGNDACCSRCFLRDDVAREERQMGTHQMGSNWAGKGW